MQRSLATTSAVAVLRCWIGEEEFAVEMAKVLAVEDAASTAGQVSAEDSNEFVYHGRPVPSIWFAAYLGVRPRIHGKTRRERAYAVVVRSQRGPTALLVDRVAPATAIPPERIHPLPPVCRADMGSPFSGVVVWNDSQADVSPPLAHWRDVAAEPGFSADRLLLLVDPDRIHEAPSPRAPGRRPTPPAAVASGGNARRGQLLAFGVSGPLESGEPVALALTTPQVLEILDLGAVLHVPLAPSYVRGLVLWRDRVAPVLDLGERLGLPPAAAGRQRLVVARATSAGDLVAFVIHPAVHVLRLPIAHQPAALPGEVDPNVVLGAFAVDQEVLIVPDLAAAAAIDSAA